MLLVVSVTDISEIYTRGFQLIPRKVSLSAYEYLMRDADMILNAYKVTSIVTFLGGLLSLTVIALLAYPLSRSDYRHRRSVSFYVIFTMLFNGGLVPWYMLISRYLDLDNTIWVLILPYLVVPWFVILLRAFFQTVPNEIIEVARIDGASEFRTFLQIVLPTSKPAIATIGLFIILRYWNDWWLSMLFIDDRELIPLQYLLYRILNNITEIQRNAEFFEAGETIDFPKESAQMAMAVVAAGPMLLVFPFFQRYFVRGLTVGAVKG
jgi:putative aldouronate transport system permease protein